MSTAILKTPVSVILDACNLLNRHRELTWEMSKRELTDRYAGQLIGTIWAVGHPLVLMGVYIFIFSFVFKLRIGGTAELPLNYVIYLLAGLIPWLSTQEAVNKASVVIAGNANLVKQVVFPIEILPVKGLLASMLTQLIGMAILAVYTIFSSGSLPWTYVLLPVLLMLQFIGVVGLCYLLACIGTYFRDLKDFVQVFCLAGMYLLPIVYLPAWVPPSIRPVLYLNPFSYLVWCYQDACYFGRIEHPWAWPVLVIGSFGSFCVGYSTFQRFKGHFGSVL